MASNDSRFVYANAVSVQAGDNDCLLRFGLAVDPANPGNMTEQVVVILTPRTAKLLQHALATTLAALESQIGPIPLPPGAAEQMKVAAAIAQKKKN